MKKKIGILTFHYAINEGAVLQAYSLAQNCQKLFPDAKVEIIDYRSLNAEKLYCRYACISRNFKSLPSTIRHYKRIRRFAKKELPLSEKKFISDDYIKAKEFIKGQKYDVIFVGSDEIWKIGKMATGRLFPNVYWLGKDIKCVKFAFAASANRMPYKELTVEQKETIRDSLNDFEYIFVRDTHTLEMVKYLGSYDSQKVSIAPDPTFMLDMPSLDLEKKLTILGFDWNKPRVAFVLSAKDLVTKSAKYFKRKGYQTIALSTYINDVDINLCGKLDVFEWANVFRYFSFCVTSRFHPIIFSLRHGTPFLAVDYNEFYRRYDSKSKSLLFKSGLSKNYINSPQGAELDYKLNPLLLEEQSSILLDVFNTQRIIAKEALLKVLNMF